MWKARGVSGALWLRCATAIAAASALAFAAGAALAQGPYDDPNTAEGWAWSQIERSETADLNEHCGTSVLDPIDENDARWRDDCRKLSTRFLQDLLTRAPWREAVPFAGIQIKGARIVGDTVDLENAKLIRSISILNSRIEAAINLVHARTDSLIWLEASLMNGRFDAGGLHSESDLLLSHNVFKTEVNLGGAKIDGGVDLTGVRLEDKLSASLVRIGGYLFMHSDDQSKASFNEVDLTDAKIAGQLTMLGADFNGQLNASLMRVGGNLIASSGQYQTRFRKVFLITAAEIAGSVTFDGARFDDALVAGLLRVDGILSMASGPQNKTSFKNVTLTGAKVAGSVIMPGVAVAGTLEATFLQVGGTLSMASMASNRSIFKDVSLTGAKVAGDVFMTGASFEGELKASALEVGGDLSMYSDADNESSFKAVNLNGAKIKGNLSMNGASFDGTLDAGLLQVDRYLFMGSLAEHKASFKDVNLVGAKAAGIYMPGASFDGTLTAGLLQVDGHLSMGPMFKQKASFKTVLLPGAKIAGSISMQGASFDGALNATSLQAGGDLRMSDVRCADKVDMSFARVGRDLDLGGASLGDFDLSGASIAADLQLGAADESADWKKKYGRPGILDLRNAHAGNLEAARQGAWPPKGQLRLAGFTFSHLGGDGGADTRQQKIGLWDSWVRLDPDYSPTSYAQLAAAFTNSGDRDAADDIRYLGRERQREVACAVSWLRGSCLVQTVLGSVAGYGIGTYGFRVLRWVFLFWLAGVVLLWWTVPAARHNGAVWCGCASLAQLLPVIKINKELTDFFDDPGRTRLKGWQVFAFSSLGLVGFLLGTILLVAVSGLTHGS